jgi:peptidoglycan-N-acetylglucosamine deacetylase
MAIRKMMLMAAIYSAAFFILSGCTKYEKAGHMNQEGIALTFDDDRIDNWFSFLPFFDSTGIKATFYICKYHSLTPDQKNKLWILQNHGHEIAYHTTNHINMVEYVVKYHHTLDELISIEIEHDLKKMQRDGYYPTSFAYPYGAHTGEIDHLLLKRYFKNVRALNGSTDYSASLAPLDKNDILFGFGLDKSSNHSDDNIIKIMQSAKNNHCCAIFVAHDINKNSRLSVTLDRLIKIDKTVKELGLKYYTVSEISK